MEYFTSIFLRDASQNNFFQIINTLELFGGRVEQVEKDLILARSENLHLISCLFKMKETYEEARFGFSQFIGLAKGLAKIAKFGEILISEEIEQQVIEQFEITSLGMLSIEGMSSQLLVCRIEKPVGDLKFPNVERKDEAIARKSEIESFNNLLRVANAVLVIGPPGSGKSIFIDQVLTQWPDREIYRTFCPSYTTGRTLKPVIDIVTQSLDVYTIQSIEERQQKIEAKLKELEIIDIGTSYLAILDFLKLNEEESILEKIELTTRVEIIANSIAEIIKRISWLKQVVIVIEDAENMDASSVNFIQHLMVKLIEEKVCFVLSSSVPQVNITGLKEFELRGIEKKHLEGLVEQVTGETMSLPPTTPFHVMQYLKLFEEEKKHYFYNQYKGEAALTHFSLPLHDVQTVVKRRLELLDGQQREFLYGLAVAGVELNPEELPIDKKMLYLFDYFVDTHFLKRFYQNYLFNSPLLHDEIYQIIPDKKGRHERLADYYRRIQGYEELAAFHYLKAEDFRKAVEFLMKSATMAIERGGYESGIYYYNQALDICQRQRDAADLEVLIALNEGLADVYRALGDEDKALKYYKVVLDSYKEILKE